MKTEDLKKGNEFQSNIKQIEGDIEILKSSVKEIEGRMEEGEIRYILIHMEGKSDKLAISETNSHYTEETKQSIKYFNQFYRDNILRTFESCKEELEKKFELLGE